MDGASTAGQAGVYAVPESHLRGFFLRQSLEPTAMGWVLQKADSDRNLNAGILFKVIFSQASLNKLSLRFTLLCPRDSFFDSVRRDPCDPVTFPCRLLTGVS